jgi:hypothetical protein
MQFGHHFGKRKPRWNIFHEQTRLYFQSIENTVLKSSVILSTLQMIVVLPLLYWTIENYSLFEQFIPLKTHLKENIIAEKNWIIFLFCASYALSLFLNYQFIKYLLAAHENIVLQKIITKPITKLTNGDRNVLSDEAAVRRRAS